MQLRVSIKKNIVTMLFVLFFVAPIASAQSPESFVSIDVVPRVPGPQENVTVSISSFLVDLDSAGTVWKVNGVTKLNGYGIKKFSVTTGAVGTTTTIDVQITPPSSQTFTQTVVLKPAEADILWEATDSYVPSFYRGKALPSSEGLINVVAMPNIKNKDASLVYRWTRNSQPSLDGSGYGKSSYTFKTSYLNRNEKVILEIAAPDGTYQAKKDVTITAGSPQIVFYAKKPLEGTDYAHALQDNFPMKTSEITLVAEPYFFSTQSKDSTQIDYTWKLNNQTITIPGKKSELIVRKEANSSGISRIDLAIESGSKLFQLAKAALLINLNNR